MDGMPKGLGSLLSGARARWDAAPRRLRSGVTYGGVLLVGIGLGSWMLDGSAPRQDGRWSGLVPVTEAADGHDHAGEAEAWTCSMHPHVRQPEPGNCPICGMALIPVPRDEDDGGDGGLPRLALSERSAALMSVQVWPTERQAVEGEVRLFGTVAWDETLIHDVALRAEGQVEELHAAFENVPVRRGEPLAEVYSPQVHAASLELLQARRAAAAGGTADLVEAAASQLAALGVSRAQVDAVLASGEPLRTFTVLSPGDGVVTELVARRGEWLGSGARILRVAGTTPVWARMEAFETDLGSVRAGAPVEVAVDALPGRVFRGTVAFVGPVVDAGRRTAEVRAHIANADGALRPGMLLRGRVGGSGRGAALVVPTTAPLLTGRRTLVYVRLRDAERPTFEAREVTLGSRRGDWWEVTGGLEEGDLVVVNGAFRIDAELQIRGRPSLMAEAGTGAPAAAQQHGATASQQVAGGAAATPGAVTFPLSSAHGRELARVVQVYLEVTGALSRDDAGATREAARALEGALESATLAGLGGDAAGAWRSARDGLRRGASALAGAADIAAQRKEFLPLSEAVERAVRTFPSEEVGPLYRAICPMVQGGTGSWLTREPKVENPYWGAAMFTCGEVQGRVSG